MLSEVRIEDRDLGIANIADKTGKDRTVMMDRFVGRERMGREMMGKVQADRERMDRGWKPMDSNHCHNNHSEHHCLC